MRTDLPTDDDSASESRGSRVVVSGGDFDDDPKQHPLRRAELAWAAVLLVAAISWYGVEAARQRGIGLFGPAESLQLAEQTPHFVAINDADWPELMLLPGIGETLARRIVADRDANGPFASVDDLQRVSGIGPVKVANMRPQLLEIGQTQVAATRLYRADRSRDGEASPR